MGSRRKLILLFVFVLSVAVLGDFILPDNASTSDHMLSSRQFVGTVSIPETAQTVEKPFVCEAGTVATGTLHCVVRVVDGDTIDVSMDGRVVRVRLIGINTPETVDPRKTVECFGREASEKVKSMLTGKFVRIETDASQGKYDKYRRLLAYVYLPDGTLFNELMISEGYAYEYTYRYPYNHQEEFKAAQNDARLHERGLWASGVCSVK